MRQEGMFIGAPIFSLQTMLALLARAEPGIPTVTPDGIYGERTARSVSAFQRLRDLPQTGRTDHTTWLHIVNAYHNALPSYAPASALNIVWQPEQVIAPGEQNTHLFPIQSMLLAIGQFFPAMPRLAVTGVHDAPSVAAVRWLQEKSGLPATGTLCQLDWTHLTRLYRLVAGSGKTPAGDSTNPL